MAQVCKALQSASASFRLLLRLSDEIGRVAQFSGKSEDVASVTATKIEPNIFPWIYMKRWFSLTAIRGVKPQTFAVASGRLIAQLIEELDKRNFLDVVDILRRIFRWGLSGSCSCLSGSVFCSLSLDFSKTDISEAIYRFSSDILHEPVSSYARSYIPPYAPDFVSRHRFVSVLITIVGPGLASYGAL